MEAVGHAEAYDFMLSLAGKRSLTEKHFLRLHQLFYWRIDADNAGQYRAARVFITGSQHIPPAASHVPAQMRTLFRAVPVKRKQLHPVDFAAWLHFRLVDIHPFIDGNGRTARLAMNVALLQAGYPLVLIPPILRREYIDTLERCHGRRGDPEPFFDFIARATLESLRDYLRLLRSE